MEGLTGYTYRRLHAEMFGGADKYYAPFIAPDREGSFRLSRLKDILPQNNESIELIPQVLANGCDSFLRVADDLAAMGYKEVNLNAGCPSGTVVPKHKGAGMLGDLTSLDTFLSEVTDKCKLPLSVKTRLGLDSTSEFEAIMAVYEKYPIRELIIHARDRAGMYKSKPDVEAFLSAYRSSELNITYNGDIFSVSDLNRIKALESGINSFMVGRGAIANPALPRMLRGGSPLSRDELNAFHGELFERTLSQGLDPRHTTDHFKELWYYLIHLFSDCDKEYKALNKSRSLSDYRIAANIILTECDFDGTRGFGG